MPVRVIVAVLSLATAVAQAQLRVPARNEIAEAMRKEKAVGYDILATANGARFSSSVILHFARQQAAASPVTPILLPHADYLEAFAEVSGLSKDRLPEFIRIAGAAGEDQFIDPRAQRVIETVVTGRQPKLAANVVAGWPVRAGVAEEYTYSDDSSTPPLRVTHKRVTSYRLVDFGDVVLFDEIMGVYGRATGGALGAMFAVIGDGRAWRSLIAYSRDNWQVTRTTARKWAMSVTQTAAVSPAGKGQKGLPDNRIDLVKIEQRLKEPFEAKYVSLDEVDPSVWVKRERELARPAR